MQGAIVSAWGSNPQPPVFRRGRWPRGSGLYSISSFSALRKSREGCGMIGQISASRIAGAAFITILNWPRRFSPRIGNQTIGQSWRLSASRLNPGAARHVATFVCANGGAPDRLDCSAMAAPPISPGELASMLHREYVCVEIRNPLLALLGHSKVAQRISDIRSDHLPEEIWVICA